MVIVGHMTTSPGKATWTPAAALASRAADLRRRCMAGKRLAENAARMHPTVAGLFLEIAEQLDAPQTGELIRPDDRQPIRLDESDVRELRDRVMARAATSPLWESAQRDSRWSLPDFATDVAALAPPHVRLSGLAEHLRVTVWDTGSGHPDRLWTLMHADGWELEAFVAEVARLTRG